jgi:hypothetical protein
MPFTSAINSFTAVISGVSMSLITVIVEATGFVLHSVSIE